MTEGLAFPPRERLRGRLLARYGADAEFGADLNRLFGDHCAALPPALAHPQPDRLAAAFAAHYGGAGDAVAVRPRFARLDISEVAELRDSGDEDEDVAGWAAAYLTAVCRLADTSALWRLDPRSAERLHSSGERIIHGWLAARSGMPTVEPAWLPIFSPFATFLPPRERPVRIVWDPQRDTRGVAQARAYEQVRAALADIAADWAAAGFDRDQHAMEDRDLDFLYAKLRGQSFAEIAKRVADDDPDGADVRLRVQRAVARMADAADVDRTGW